jgi:hypothetical protein
MSSKGYIRVFRQIQDCWIWDTGKFDKRSAWIDLLMLANHSDKRIVFNGEYITIKKSQYLTSIRNLANRWLWSTSSVTSFLRLLEKDKMIIRDSDKYRTLITIVNYSIYQDSKYTKETVSDTPIDTVTTTVTTTSTETNNTLNTLNTLDSNNNAHRSAPYSEHFEEFWRCYKKKNDKKRAYACYMARLKEGFSEDELLIACKNYMDECEKQHREDRYIKDAKTFIGVNTPFVDYLPKGGTGNYSKSMEYGRKIYQGDESRTAPYFGFPPEWFEGEQLIEERITPLVCDKSYVQGGREDYEFTVEELKGIYESRKRGKQYEQCFDDIFDS